MTHFLRLAGTVALLTLLLLTTAPAQAQLVAAVLPVSRRVVLGTPGTAFATIINAGSIVARGCSIAPITNVPATFVYQTTDPLTNQLTGQANTPVDIPAGGAQSFMFAFTPTANVNDGTRIEFRFGCTNTDAAVTVPGVNTFNLGTRTDSTPDDIAVIMTPTNDGTLDIPSTTGNGAFAVAAINLGGAGGPTYASVRSPSSAITGLICRTNPVTSACITLPGESTAGGLAPGSTATFAVFVHCSQPVPFDPANTRIVVDFWDVVSTIVYGSTSVAVRTVP